MVDVSIILPCRNEEKSIGKCITQIKKVIEKNKIDAEIIVSDSSTDDSPYIAKKHKVNVIEHGKIGYGVAIMEGVKAAKGSLLIIADSDGTYDFSEIPRFIKEIKEGSDLIIGSRLKGKIERGAMPWHHQHIGNPLLSKILNQFFGTNISDTHSGFRAINKKTFEELNLKTTGMEFASEMIIKAAKLNLSISEVPINYSKRIGESKLESLNDGWRHLRFMLMFSPTFLFFIPGTVLLALGLCSLLVLMFGTIYMKNIDIGLNIAMISSFISIFGYQLINLGLYSKIYAIHIGFEKHDKFLDFLARNVPLEKGVIAGILIVVSASIALFFISLSTRKLFFPLTLAVLGFQTIFSVFFISMMLVEKNI